MRGFLPRSIHKCHQDRLVAGFGDFSSSALPKIHKILTWWKSVGICVPSWNRPCFRHRKGLFVLFAQYQHCPVGFNIYRNPWGNLINIEVNTWSCFASFWRRDLSLVRCSSQTWPHLPHHKNTWQFPTINIVHCNDSRLSEHTRWTSVLDKDVNIVHCNDSTLS